MTELISFYWTYAVYLYLWFIVSIYLRNKYEAGELSGPLKYPAIACVYMFVGADIFYNWLISLPFWEMPRGWLETTSMRLARYVQDDTNPKRQFAAKVLGWLLNLVDPGHIPGS